MEMLLLKVGSDFSGTAGINHGKLKSTRSSNTDIPMFLSFSRLQINNPASVKRRGYKMGSADVLPTVPRVDLYHRQNVSLPRLEPEKGWIMGLDPINFGPLLNG